MAEWKEIPNFPVEQNGKTLQMPFSGSFNSAQVESIDLNGDGVEDLVVFDRTCQKLSTFLVQITASSITYQYSSIYENAFPFMENWMHLIDFDGDGKKDLFTYTAAGIKVFRNTGQGKVNQFTLFQEPLYSEGFSGKINLYVAPSDIPAIGDLDKDGDIDILAFEPGGHFLELHQNFSIENGAKAGLVFKRTVQGWGNFIHNDCRDIVFNSPLSNTVQTQSLKSVEKILHVGNAVSLWDTNKNGQFGLLFGHISCSNLVHLENQGSGLTPSFSIPLYDFPSGQAIQVSAFAYASPLDVNFDGNMDLLVSTNTTDNVNYTQNFQQNLVYFQKEGTQLSKISNSFLQQDMIDVGENASPVFWDVDEDGDLDLLIGNSGIRCEKGVRASIFFYENVGTKSSSFFVFRSHDFLKFSEKTQATDLRLQLADWNSDGKNDLLINYETFVNPQMQVLLAGQTILKSYDLKTLSPGTIPYFKDVNQDGILDGLLLTKVGQIQRFQLKENISGELDWELINPDFLSMTNIKNWSLQSFDLVDVFGDGKKQWIGTDKLGFFHIAEMDLVNNRIVEKQMPTGLSGNVGRNSSIQSVDWNQDGKADLVIGTGGGGVRLIQNTSTSPIFEKKESDIQIWPNPNQGEFYVRTYENGQLKMVDLLGRIILENVRIRANESKRLQINSIHKGIYFVEFLGENGYRVSQKLLLE